MKHLKVYQFILRMILPESWLATYTHVIFLDFEYISLIIRVKIHIL